MILVSFGIATKCAFGAEACSHYNDRACTLPSAIKNGYYVNQWSVHMPGVPKDEARQLLEQNGFVYLGQVARCVFYADQDAFECTTRSQRFVF